jgi:alcohol dehydrogenase
MKAAYLDKAGEPVSIVDAPEPELQAGGVIVRILAAPVLSFMKKVFSGELGYAMAAPWIPGANGIGVIENAADDAIGLAPGQQVFIDPYIYSHTTTNSYDGILIGMTALGTNSASLQRRWRNGTFAEKALLPAECLTVTTGVEEVDLPRLATLSFAAIAYGGLMKGGLRSGQTLVVSGATGNIGASAVLVGLAMGAKLVVAVGREENVLQEVKALNEKRIRTVKLQGSLVEDKHAIGEAAGGADLVYDILGNVPTIDPTAAAIYALRRGGTAVLMGGVQAPLNLPYSHIMLNEISIKGGFMYPRSAPRDLINMVAAGTLDLSKVRIREFPLTDIREALDFAERTRGLEYTLLIP